MSNDKLRDKAAAHPGSEDMSATQGKPVAFEGLAYGQLRLLVLIPHGKGTRQIHVEMPAEAIMRLADCIRGCPQHVYEDPRTGDMPADMAQVQREPRFVPMWIGHAVWHLEHPEDLMPCPPQNRKVYDVPGLIEATKTEGDHHG